MIRTLSQLAASACLVVLIGLVVPGRAESTPEWHLHLTRSQPAKDTLLASPPTEIRLWFSQPPTVALSRITLTGPAGKAELGPITRDPKDSTLITAHIVSELPGGNYSLAWRAASADGHPIRGTFPFSIRPE